MPSADIAALTAAVTTGFANLTTAVGAQAAVDLAPITEQIQRVADATEASNAQVATVIGADSAGDNRVRTNPNVP